MPRMHLTKDCWVVVMKKGVSFTAIEREKEGMILWTYLVVEIVFVPCAPVGIIFKCASLTGSVSLMPLVP